MTVDERIDEWRNHFRRRQAVSAADVDEMEDHLRNQIEALQAAGLDESEALLVAVKRLGEQDAVALEFAREYSERLWKQLVLAPGGEGSSPARRDGGVALLCAAAAAVAIKLPELFGHRLHGPLADSSYYLRNFSLFVLPFLAAFFAWKRGLAASGWLRQAAPFLLGALGVNLLPFVPRGQTEQLSAIHLPIALWMMIAFAYTGGAWRRHEGRMNYVRFSGEWFIYLALIALGGGVLVGFTAFIFQAIGLDPKLVISDWLLPCGVMGAVIVAAWLVEAKQSVIENMAPVLTWLFTPLFAALLLVFVVTMLVTGSAIQVGREVLIGFDLLLVLVLGLLLYSISARDSQAPPRRFDLLQLLLVVCALLVDVLALWAISARISEFGASPNKAAALGLNLLLLVNLGGSAVHYARFLGGRTPFPRLERWQTATLPLFAAWAWVVALLFPMLFGYR